MLQLDERIRWRVAALIPAYALYRLQGDDRLLRGALTGAGVALVLWGAIDLYLLGRGRFPGRDADGAPRARRLALALVAVGVSMGIAGVLAG